MKNFSFLLILILSFQKTFSFQQENQQNPLRMNSKDSSLTAKKIKGALSVTNVKVYIYQDSILNRNFGGLGFHSFHHVFNLNDTVWNEVVYKRWRELSPSFVVCPVSMK